jgi:hypothetical protein
MVEWKVTITYLGCDIITPWKDRRAIENEALLSGSGMIFAGWRGSLEMTRQRFCTTAEKLYNCNLISLLQKKCTTAISFHNCKILRRNKWVEGIDNASVIKRHLSIGINAETVIKLIITNSLNSVYTKNSVNLIHTKYVV